MFLTGEMGQNFLQMQKQFIELSLQKANEIYGDSENVLKI